MTKEGYLHERGQPPRILRVFMPRFSVSIHLNLQTHHGSRICDESLDCGPGSIIDVHSLHCPVSIVLESTRYHSWSYTRGLDLMVRMLLRCDQAWPVRLENQGAPYTIRSVHHVVERSSVYLFHQVQSSASLLVKSISTI